MSAVKQRNANGKTTLRKKGKNPPEVTLCVIAKDLFSYFRKFGYICDTEKEIEKKYRIKKEHANCWPAGDIKRAWGKTQRMDKSSKRRKCWALVLIMQLLKREIRNEDLMESGNADQKYNEGIWHETSDQTTAERENGRGDDGVHPTDDISQVCGKAERMKENSEEKSSQSNDELEKAKPAEQHSGEKHMTFNYSMQIHNVNQGLAGTLDGVQETGHIHNTPDDAQSQFDGNTALQDQTIYIRIPVMQMYISEPTFTQHDVEDVRSPFKLTHGLPSDTDIRRRKSYVMSFDSRTNNAEWVYEILNQQTLANNYVPQGGFGNVYVKGHLAAAANHRWCREAHQDTFLNSNILPQHVELNRRTWKMLENYCRDRANDLNVRNVHVYTGPIYRHMVNPVELGTHTVEFKKNPVEWEKKPVELKRSPIVLGKTPVELKKNTVERRKYLVELKQNPIELETNPVELEKDPAQWKNISEEMENKPVELEKSLVELTRNPREWKKNPVELTKNSVEWKKVHFELKNNPLKMEMGPGELTKNSREWEMNPVELTKKTREWEKNPIELKNPREWEKNPIKLAKNSIEWKKIHLELEKSPLKLENKPVELTKNLREWEKNPVELEKSLELTKNLREREMNPVNLTKNRREWEKNPVELKNSREWEKNPIKLTKNSIEWKKIHLELEKSPLKLENKPVELKKNLREWGKNPVELKKSLELTKNPRELEKYPVEVKKNPVELTKNPVELTKNPSKFKKQPVELEGKIVPSDFFKVVIVENVDGTVDEPECFLMPNEMPRFSELEPYMVDINNIQSLSGLRFTENTSRLRDKIMTVTSQGKDLNEKQCDVELAVRINS